mgnify:CR=1 FL=1
MSKKYEVRADVNMTLDFVIECDDESEARAKVKSILRYVEGGKLDSQQIRFNLPDGDELKSCFVMECKIDDVNEAD